MVRPYGPGIFKNEKQQAAVMAKLKYIPAAKGKKLSTNYVGSKRQYLDFTIKNTPSNVKTVYDGFSGSGVVAYEYKKLGKKVIANDHSRYAYHIARAVIENDTETISDEELEMLLKPNPNRTRFAEKTYKGCYLSTENLRKVDNIRSNIDKLKGYKKDIALAALGRACQAQRESHGFAYSKILKDEGDINEAFKRYVKELNNAVFKGKYKCKATNEDFFKQAPKIKADLAYLDPPYIGRFSEKDYLNQYHFNEAIMVKGNGVKIDHNKKGKPLKLEKEVKFVPKKAIQTLNEMFEKSKHIKHWNIAYSNKAIPKKQTMKKIIKKYKNNVQLKTKNSKYTFRAGIDQHTTPAQEYLYICS